MTSEEATIIAAYRAAGRPIPVEVEASAFEQDEQARRGRMRGRARELRAGLYGSARQPQAPSP